MSIEQLIRDNHPFIYRYAYRLVGQVADAEDLTQQTFLAACQNLDQLRDPSSARSWLMAIARNHFCKSARRKKAQTADAVDWEQLAEEGSPPTWDSEALQQALEQLPDEFRLVLLMFYFEQKSYREIAAALELPLGTVMSRLSRAKSYLRARLGGLGDPGTVRGSSDQTARRRH